MTRETLSEQLDTLRRQGRRTLVWCWVVIVLAGAPVSVYTVRLLHLARAHSSPRSVVSLGLALFAFWIVVLLICMAFIKATVARHAPACPLCSGRITEREQNNVLASGRCPYCKGEMFASG